jgi:hypothetical protein
VLAGQEESLGKHDSTDSPRKPSASEQHRRFIETARQLECDEDKERFEEKLKQIATAKAREIPKKSGSEMADIEGTAWRNSGGPFPSGNAGYGIKINSIDDRRRFFPKGTVTLIMGNIRCTANTDKKSFWDPRCGELIRAPIGQWMRSLGLIPWPDHDPHKFGLRQISPAVFEVRLTRRSQ